MAHDNQAKNPDEGAAKVFEKIMGTITVGLIFRHCISGAVFVAAYYYAQDSAKTVENLLSAIEKHGTGLGIVALLAGTLIYSLHRAITNPMLEALRHFVIWLSTLSWWLRWIRILIMPDAVRKLMESRWDAGENFQPTTGHITSWGEYIHMQYTAALAMIFGSAAAHFLGGFSADWPTQCLLTWTAVIFAAAGFHSDCRKQLVEEKYYEKRKAEKTAKPAHAAPNNAAQ